MHFKNPHPDDVSVKPMNYLSQNEEIVGYLRDVCECGNAIDKNINK
jgi:hypothetical protein